jgi:dihydroneopterin aldolase
VSDDKVLMRGLMFYGYHGVLAEETKLGQRFIVDIEMSVDTRAAGQSDDLAKTVNYVAVHAEVRKIVEGPPSKLIETVAERIAEMILGGYEVDAVRVRVKKPDVPIAATLEYVGVEVVRRRSAARGSK